MPFGKRLKEARLKKGLTQEQLAQAVGVTKGAIGNYESEISSPKEIILIKLMEILNIDANYLFQDMVANQPNDVSTQTLLTPDEEILLSGYRSLSDNGKAYVHQTVEMAVATMPKSKNVPVPDLGNLA